MELRIFLKKGLVISFVYLVVTLFLFMATERIERLDKQNNDFRNTNTSISLKLAK